MRLLLVGESPGLYINLEGQFRPQITSPGHDRHMQLQGYQINFGSHQDLVAFPMINFLTHCLVDLEQGHKPIVEESCNTSAPYG